MASNNEGYLSHSWGLLTRDEGWIKPLLVLAAAQLVPVIGPIGVNGYVLEDVAIDYLEQTPKSLLDQFNILDAQGIRKITELTAAQNVRREEFAIARRYAKMHGARPGFRRVCVRVNSNVANESLGWLWQVNVHVTWRMAVQTAVIQFTANLKLLTAAIVQKDRVVVAHDFQAYSRLLDRSLFAVKFCGEPSVLHFTLLRIERFERRNRATACNGGKRKDCANAYFHVKLTMRHDSLSILFYEQIPLSNASRASMRLNLTLCRIYRCAR